MKPTIEELYGVLLAQRQMLILERDTARLSEHIRTLGHGLEMKYGGTINYDTLEIAGDSKPEAA